METLGETIRRLREERPRIYWGSKGANRRLEELTPHPLLNDKNAPKGSQMALGGVSLV